MFIIFDISFPAACKAHFFLDLQFGVSTVTGASRTLGHLGDTRPDPPFALSDFIREYDAFLDSMSF